MGFLDDVERFTNAEVFVNEPMVKHTTLHVGGTADYFIKPRWLKDVYTCYELSKKYSLKLITIGMGSNLLVSDKGFRGVVLSMENLNSIKEVDGEIVAYAGVKLKDFFKFLLSLGYTGFEGLVDIPASVGGAITMNAGANFCQIQDNLVRVFVIDENGLKVYDKKECDFHYRKSKFINSNQTIAYACFSYPKGDIKETQSKIDAFREKRTKSQPKGFTAGSVFKNPKDMYSASIIESLNLKGYGIGGAKISEKHANFIVCEKGAKAQDVYNLINHVKNLVFREKGILLESEIQLLGDFDDINW